MTETAEESPDLIVVERGNLRIKCGDCGFAIYKVEIAGEVYGSFIDYNTKDRGQISILFCGECWDKVKNHAAANIRSGIAKRRALESVTKEDEKVIEEQKEQDFT